MNGQEHITAEAIALLQRLIACPSPSREEQGTADLLAAFLAGHGVEVRRVGHNVWARGRHHDPAKPTLLLNSHHDTVRPVAGWSRDPYAATVEGDRLFGLGSNDAGGALVALVATFLLHRDRSDLPFNLLLAATAEEEVGGEGGIRSVLPQLGPVHMAIVGEPTGMRMAVAEKGLLVLDCTAHGRSGHAARNEGDNAILRALPDIQWFRDHRFARTSPTLGEVRMSVTMVQAGTAHNVVPDRCQFTVDIRVTDAYTLQEVLDEVRAHVRCEVQPRSLRLAPSGIAMDHPLVRAGKAIGIETFGSPTLSDQAFLTLPSIKLGPGLSERSHTADEHILLSELRDGVAGYCALLQHLHP